MLDRLYGDLAARLTVAIFFGSLWALSRIRDLRKP